jgi:hypothetical protein
MLPFLVRLLVMVLLIVLPEIFGFMMDWHGEM